LNGSKNSNGAAIATLCPTCGLCCNSVIFANVGLRPDDDAARLKSLGLPVAAPRSALRPPRLAQPCECVLLKSVQAARTETAAALRIICTARERADTVRRLLGALGDTDEHLPLSARFRRTGKRLQQRELDEATADTYARLTLAVHDLNLLLGDAFYPGNGGRET
jgi:hypothetical protein